MAYIFLKAKSWKRLFLVLLICYSILFLTFLNISIERRDNELSSEILFKEGLDDSKFVFPSIEERVKYYMGSWYNKSMNPEEIDCRLMIVTDPQYRSDYADKDLLYTFEKLKDESLHNHYTSVSEYLTQAYQCLTLSTSSDKKIIAIRVGDSSSSSQIPVIAKTRRAGILTSKSSSDYFSIIWPLGMVRHFKGVDQVGKLERSLFGGVTKWKDKKPTLVWRGAVTGVSLSKNEVSKILSRNQPTFEYGPRMYVVNKYCDANINDIDIAFRTDVSDIETRIGCKRRNYFMSMKDQLKFKYILNIEGNDVSTGLKWQLASNSVVFMAKPTTVSFAMEDLLVPFVHYVPVKDDYSNLMEMVEWARQNDQKCEWISRQASLYMNKLWNTKQAQNDYNEIRKQLAIMYSHQFGDALQTCMHEN